jgi:hypothetical protein
MATEDDYIVQVWERLSKGKPQPVAGLWRVAVQTTLPNALQRLGDRVAADDYLYPLLMNAWDVELGIGGVAGQAILIGPDGLDPVILLSEGARKRVRVTMEDPNDASIDLDCDYLPNFNDLKNPPPIPDDRKRYYTFWQRSLVIRDRTGQDGVMVQTPVTLYGCKAPEIDDFALDGELFDNLVDIGCAIVMESGSLAEVIRQAEVASSEAPQGAGVPG